MNDAFRAADDRLRACGLDLVMRLLALVRVGRSYQVENQVFRQQLHVFVEALQPVFAEAHEATLISLDDDLYLNDVRLPVKSTSLRFHQALMQELTRRRIVGVRILEGVEEPELERFFRLFLQPDAYAGPALLEACVAEGTHRILPAIHASTQSGDPADPLDPASYAQWTKETVPTGSGGGVGGGAGGGDGSPSGPPGPGAPPAGLRPVASKNYSLAMLGARSLLTTTALQKGVPLSRAKRVVQPLIDGAFAGEPVVLGLSTLSHHHEYSYTHAVNVCMVAVTIGHVLGLDRRALADLGVAALLHDTGKAAVYDRIHHPLEEFDEEERRLAESHPLEGAKLIARSTTLNSSTLRCMRVALEHHAAGPGPGFPALPEGWRSSRLSGIVAVADCFVSLQMHRSERGLDVTPHVALGMVLGPLAGRFDPVLLWALVRSVGFYPPGQLVELSDGRTALVLAPDPDDPARPRVRVVLDECGVPFSAIESRELRPLPAALHVKRALPAAEYPSLPAAA
jgi:HD-GYP domain-containing protein (c-di-GMP phosphodiesterase class II)